MTTAGSVSQASLRASRSATSSIGRATPAILAALGALWLVAGIAILALVPAGANSVGVAWVAWGAVHLFAAWGTRSGITVALVLDAILAIGGLVGATFIVVFIEGMNLSLGRSFDLGATWFSPLNGWATLLVFGGLVVADLLVLAGAVQAVGRRADRKSVV